MTFLTQKQREAFFEELIESGTWKGIPFSHIDEILRWFIEQGFDINDWENFKKELLLRRFK